jgi:hypothetical protein
MNYFANTTLQQSTYKKYQLHITRWLALFPEGQNNLTFVYTHPSYSIVQLRKYLSTRSLDSPQSVNAYIKAVMSAAAHNTVLLESIDKEIITQSDAKWKNHRQTTYEMAFSYRQRQEPSLGQAVKSGSTVKLSDIIAHRDGLPDGSIDKLLIGFYTHIPPVRADYHATEILNYGDTPTSPNHIFHNHNQSYLVLTEFKTSKVYHTITNELPAELHRQLTLSLTTTPRRFLFLNQRGQPFTRNGYTKWTANQLFKSLKKDLTLTMLRHIYISSLDFNRPFIELQEIGRKMGHCVTQQVLYRWRDDPTTIDKLEE